MNKINIKKETKIIRSYFITIDNFFPYLVEKINNEPYNIYHFYDHIGTAKTLKDAIKLIKKSIKE